MVAVGSSCPSKQRESVLAPYRGSYILFQVFLFNMMFALLHVDAVQPNYCPGSERSSLIQLHSFGRSYTPLTSFKCCLRNWRAGSKVTCQTRVGPGAAEPDLQEP
jgi:hypothetical protein